MNNVHVDKHKPGLLSVDKEELGRVDSALRSSAVDLNNSMLLLLRLEFKS